MITRARTSSEATTVLSRAVKIWKFKTLLIIFKIKDATGLEISTKMYFSVTFNLVYIRIQRAALF